MAEFRELPSQSRSTPRAAPRSVSSPTGSGGGFRELSSGSGRSSTPRRASTPARRAASPGGGGMDWGKVGIGDSGGDGGEPKARSLFKQFTDPLTQLPQGLFELAKGAAYTPVGLTRMVADAARGETRADMSGDFFNDMQQQLREYTPLAETMLSGGYNTADRIHNLSNPLSYAYSAARNEGDFLHDARDEFGELQTAVKEGRIVDELLEDVGNVALIAGGIGAVAGRTSAVKGLTSRALRGAQGKTATAPRSLSAAARAVPDRTATFNRATPTKVTYQSVKGGVPEAQTTVLRAPRSTTLSGGIEQVVQPAIRPGRGIAGVLEDSGSLQAAKAVERFGQRARKVSIGADYLDPSTPLFVAGAKGAQKVARKVAARQGRRGSDWANRSERRADSRETAHSAREAVTDSVVQVQRAAIEGAQLAEKQGLTRPQGRAVLMSIDNRYDALADGVRRVTEEHGVEAAQRYLDKTQADIPGGNKVHLTLDDLDAYNQYRDRDVAIDGRDVMDQVQELVRRQADARTGMRQQAQAAGVEGALNMDEHLAETRIEIEEDGTLVTREATPDELLDPGEGRLIAPEMRASELARLDEPMRLSEEAATRELGRLAPQVQQAARRADIREVFDAVLPEPGQAVDPATTLDHRKGAAADAQAELALLQERMRPIQERYEAALDNPNLPDDVASRNMVQEMEDQIRDIREQVKFLTDEQDTLLRQSQLDLSEADRAVLDRPEVDLSGLDDVDAIRELAERTHQIELDRTLTELDHLTDGQRPQQPQLLGAGDAKERFGVLDEDRRLAPEMEWWNDPESAVWKGRKRRKQDYVRDGYIAKKVDDAEVAPGDQGMDTYDFADQVAERSGDPDLKVQEAFVRYLDAVDRVYEARVPVKKGNALVLERIKSEFGQAMSNADIELALNNKREFRARRKADLNKTLDDVAVAIHSDPDSFGSFMEAWDQEIAAGGDGRTFVAEYAADLLDDPQITGEFAEALQAFDAVELQTWLESGKAPDPAIEAAVRAQVDDLAQAIRSAEASLDQSKAALNDFNFDKNARDKASLGIADQKLKVERAETDVQRADGTENMTPWAREDGPSIRQVIDQAIDETSGHGRDPVPGEATRPYREPTGSISMAERQTNASVRARVKADMVARKYADVEQKRNRYRQQRATLEDRLSRSVQERLVTQNNSVIDRMTRSARQAISPTPLGGVKQPVGGKPYIDGVMGQLARKYDFEDALIATLDEMDPGEFDLTVPNEHAQAFWDTANGALDDVPSDVAAMDRAVLAEDLAVTLEQFKGSDDVMSGYSAMSEMNERLQSYDNTLGADGRRGADTAATRQARHISEDLRLRMEEQFNAYRKQRENLLGRVFDDATAVMPARFRAPAINSRRSVGALLDLADEAARKGDMELASSYARMAEEAPTTMQGLVDQGVTNPQHLIGGGEVAATRQALGSRSATKLTSPRTRGERQLKSGYRTLDPTEYARVEAQEMAAMTVQTVVKSLAEDPNFSHRALEIEPIREALVAHRERTDGRPMPRQDYDKLLADNGYARVEYSPTQVGGALEGAPGRRTLDTEGRGSTPEPGTSVAEVASGPAYLNERVMSTHLIKELNELRGASNNKWLTLYDQTLQLWKTPTLAWSPAWLSNNLIGNAFMAMVGGGMSPLELTRQLNNIRKTNKAAGVGGVGQAFRGGEVLPAIAPDQIGSHGLTFNEQRLARSLSDQSTRMGRVLGQMGDKGKSKLGRGNVNVGGFTEGMYAVNEFTDNLFRTSVYNNKVWEFAPEIPDGLLDTNGNFKSELTYSDDLIADLKQRSTSPDETVARQAMQQLDEIEAVRAEHGKAYDDIIEATHAADKKAVGAALNIMGDFTRMTRMERNYIKRVIPFYAWMRHQSQAAVRLAISSPLRAAWLASLADVLQDEPMGDAENALFGQSINVGGLNINLASANPYSTLTDIIANPFNPTTALRSVSPVVKEPVKFATGFDISNMDIASRPTGQQNTGIFGNNVNTPSLSRFPSDPLGAIGEGIYSALGTIPQVRGIRDFALGAGQARYDSGDRVGGGQYDRNVPLISSLAQISRFPVVPRDMRQTREDLQRLDQRQGR